MSETRNKDEVIVQILALCLGEGSNKAKIVNDVGMNFSTVTPYLTLLAEKGYIVVYELDLTIYRTTEKGTRALDVLKTVEEICS